MNDIDLLILNGSPGVGKSTLSKALSEHLREKEIKHAVIELDDLAEIYPLNLKGVMYKNLASIWANYIALGDIKIIIPTFLDPTNDELTVVLDSAPAKTTRLCELVAPIEVLVDRVGLKNISEFKKEINQKLVKKYNGMDESEKYGDFRISTHDRTIEETLSELIANLGW